MKNKLLSTILLGGGAILTILLSSTGNPNDPQQYYYAQPPIPTEYTVQKLATPDSLGNTMILRVKFVEDTAMLQTLNIYQNGSVALRLKDDGVYPDAVANDYKYSILVKQDLTDFLNQIAALESKWQSAGQVTHFYGHSAESIPYSEQVKFDVTAFNNKDEVKFNAFLMDATNCEADLKKENSLFITDLSVVEHPSYTYNIVSKTGNPIGAWTFGQMMKNIYNQSNQNISTKTFLKEWIKLGRMSAHYVGQFIIPWIVKARRETVDPLYLYPHMVLDNALQIDPIWEQEWDNTDEDALLQFAPFKLTAIVNRLDLRGNFAYNSSLNNAGETRFIFTHIAPVNGNNYHINQVNIGIPYLNYNVNAGNPIFHTDLDFSGGGNGPGAQGSFFKEDWRGMNVIFEYGNVQTDLCQIVNFANQWADLSFHTLGSVDYMNGLINITNTVTAANSNLSMPNKSALARIRSNEKCFAPINPGGGSGWSKANWEFRQFELNPSTNLFQLAPLTNTPDASYNYANNIKLDHASGTGYNTSGNEKKLLNWIYSNTSRKNRVLQGNHLIPKTFTYNGSTYDFLNDLTAEVKGEAVHFFGFDENEFESKYPPNPTNAQLAEAKKIRHQISLNTCQGCHAGETKVAFTQVRPLGYGQNGDYWSSIPDVIQGTQGGGPIFYTDFDFRSSASINGNFYWHSGNRAGNIGATKDEFIPLGSNTPVSIMSDNYNIDMYTNTYPFQVVSAFLTGRAYHGNNNWEDDNIDPNDFDNDFATPSILNDESLLGKFFVNDPMNSVYILGFSNQDNTPFPYKGETKWKFNDLEMRKQRLCDLIGINCNAPFVIVHEINTQVDVLNVVSELNTIPLPLGAH